MRRLSFALSALLVLFLTMVLHAAEPRVDTVPLHHFLELKTGYHLYTTDPTEISVLKITQGWRDQGIAAHVYPKRIPGTVALYRVRKLEFGGQNSFYTVDMDVANSFITQGGWEERGVAGYIAPTPMPGTVPLFRLYHDVVKQSSGGLIPMQVDAGGDQHYYTTSEAERDSAINDNGFKSVRVEGYVWPAPAHYGGVPQIKVPAGGGGLKQGVTSSIPPTKEQNDVLNTLGAKGCKPFLGRIDDFLCSMQDGFDMCQAYKNRGRVQQCRPGTGVNPNASTPKIKITPQKDTVVIPLSFQLKDRQERTKKVGSTDHKFIDYTLAVSNADKIPADWFAPLTVLPPEACWGSQPSDARLVLEISWGTTTANRKGECRPLTSRSQLAAIKYTHPEGRGVADFLQLTVRDRLTNLRHSTGSYPVAAFGIGDLLNKAGCFNLLGRPADFVCKTATGMAACQNLKNQGKPIECRQGK